MVGLIIARENHLVLKAKEAQPSGMASDDINPRLLQRAAKIFGEEVLEIRLGVTAVVLQSWINGTSQPPDAAMMAVIALLAEDALRDLDNTWPFKPPST